MLNRVAVYLTDVIARDCNEEDRETYIYGWEMILSTLGAVGAIAILGAVFGRFFETAVYMLCFLSIRAYAGGSHASTYLRCFLKSNLYFIIPLALTLFTGLHYSLLCAAIFALAGALLVLIRAPQDHPNKRLSAQEHIQYKRKSRIITGIWLLSIALGYFVPASIPFVWWISVGILQAGITLIKGK